MFTSPNLPFFVGSMGNITDSGYPYDNTYIYMPRRPCPCPWAPPAESTTRQDVNLTYDPAGYNPVANTYFVNLYDLPNNGLHFTAAGRDTDGRPI